MSSTARPTRPSLLMRFPSASSSSPLSIDDNPGGSYDNNEILTLPFLELGDDILVDMLDQNPIRFMIRQPLASALQAASFEQLESRIGQSLKVPVGLEVVLRLVYGADSSIISVEQLQHELAQSLTLCLVNCRDTATSSMMISQTSHIQRVDPFPLSPRSRALPALRPSIAMLSETEKVSSLMRQFEGIQTSNHSSFYFEEPAPLFASPSFEFENTDFASRRPGFLSTRSQIPTVADALDCVDEENTDLRETHASSDASSSDYESDPEDILQERQWIVPIVINQEHILLQTPDQCRQMSSSHCGTAFKDIDAPPLPSFNEKDVEIEEEEEEEIQPQPQCDEDLEPSLELPPLPRLSADEVAFQFAKEAATAVEQDAEVLDEAKDEDEDVDEDDFVLNEEHTEIVDPDSIDWEDCEDDQAVEQTDENEEAASEPPFESTFDTQFEEEVAIPTDLASTDPIFDDGSAVAIPLESRVSCSSSTSTRRYSSTRTDTSTFAQTAYIGSSDGGCDQSNVDESTSTRSSLSRRDSSDVRDCQSSTTPTSPSSSSYTCSNPDVLVARLSLSDLPCSSEEDASAMLSKVQQSSASQIANDECGEHEPEEIDDERRVSNVQKWNKQFAHLSFGAMGGGAPRPLNKPTSSASVSTRSSASPMMRMPPCLREKAKPARATASSVATGSAFQTHRSLPALQQLPIAGSPALVTNAYNDAGDLPPLVHRPSVKPRWSSAGISDFQSFSMMASPLVNTPKSLTELPPISPASSTRASLRMMPHIDAASKKKRVAGALRRLSHNGELRDQVVGTFNVFKFPKGQGSDCTVRGRVNTYLVDSMAKKLSSRGLQARTELVECLRLENEILQRMVTEIPEGYDGDRDIDRMLESNSLMCSIVENVAAFAFDVSSATSAARRSSTSASDNEGSSTTVIRDRDESSAAIVRFRVTKVNRLHKDSTRIVRAFPPRGLITISKPSQGGQGAGAAVGPSPQAREETVFEIGKCDYISCTIVSRLKHCLMIRFDSEGHHKRHQYRFESEHELQQFYQYVQTYLEA